MKVSKIPEANITIAKNQSQYTPLPALVMDDGAVISCWKLSFLERLQVLFTGTIFFSLLTFGHSTQPQFASIRMKDHIGPGAKPKK